MAKKVYLSDFDKFEKAERARWKKEDAIRKKHPRATTKVYAFANKVTLYDPTLPLEKGRNCWVISDDYISFVDLVDVDKVQRKALGKWLYGQTRPLIPGVKEACYSWDYQKFYDAFIRGKVAPITD